MNVFIAILSGVPMTLLVTVCALLIGMVLGVPLALMRRSKVKVLNWIAVTFIEFFRGIPPIVWLFIIFFGVGQVVRGMNPLLASIVGLGVVSSAYMAEIYRGGLRAIAVGQWEAGGVLGMKHSTVLRDVIGPQVFRASLPATATYAIGLIKDSSVASAIGVYEISRQAKLESQLTADALGPYLIAAAVYVLLTIPTAWATRSLEAKMRKRVAR